MTEVDFAMRFDPAGYDSIQDDIEYDARAGGDTAL